MPSPAWEDLDAFFDIGDFAERVEIDQVDGSTRAIDAIFDTPDEEAEAGEYEFDTRAPRLTCRATDAEGIRRGAYATVGGVRYDVVDSPHYDGTGLAMIELAAP